MGVNFASHVFYSKNIIIGRIFWRLVLCKYQISVHIDKEIQA